MKQEIQLYSSGQEDYSNYDITFILYHYTFIFCIYNKVHYINWLILVYCLPTNLCCMYCGSDSLGLPVTSKFSHQLEDTSWLDWKSEGGGPRWSLLCFSICVFRGEGPPTNRKCPSVSLSPKS